MGLLAPEEIRLIEESDHVSAAYGSTYDRLIKIKKRYAARVVGGAVSEDLFRRGLCLPSGTALTQADLDRVIETIRGCR